MTKIDPADVAIIMRPIDEWTGELTADRLMTPFTAGLTDTEWLLRTEVAALGADEAVVQVAIPEAGFTIAGGIRAHATPDHPGVIVSFDSRHGPLTYATDRFVGRGHRADTNSGWHANLRAVALALEALRKVDRYGVGTGRQYTGWKAIGTGEPVAMGPAMTRAEAAAVLIDAADVAPTWDARDVLDGTADVSTLYRKASKLHHPDRGGDPAAFARITDARDALTS